MLFRFLLWAPTSIKTTEASLPLSSNKNLITKQLCFFQELLSYYTVTSRDGEGPQISTSPPVHQSSYLVELPVQSSPQIWHSKRSRYRSPLQFLNQVCIVHTVPTVLCSTPFFAHQWHHTHQAGCPFGILSLFKLLLRVDPRLLTFLQSGLSCMVRKQFK